MTNSSDDSDRGPIERATDPERRRSRRERASDRRVPLTTLPVDGFQRHETNGDTGPVVAFSKGIPPAEERARTNGVLPEADFDAFVGALLDEEYEGVLGLTDEQRVDRPDGERPLVNPAAATSFVTTGVDSNDVAIGRPTSVVDQPPGAEENEAKRTDAAPAFASPRTAAEVVELYWQAIMRDVPFAEYDDNGAVERAIDELTGLPGYRSGAGRSMPDTVNDAFRGVLPGAQQGPYVSQFLYVPVPRGAHLQRQVFRPFDDGNDGGPDRDALAGVDPAAELEAVDLNSTFEPDYLESFERWRDVQNGVTFDPQEADSSREVASAVRSGVALDTRRSEPTSEADAETPKPFEGPLLDDDRRHITTGRDLATYVRANPSHQPYLAAALILQNNGARLDPGISSGAAVTPNVPGAFVDYGRTEYQTAVVDVTQASFHAAWYRKWLVHRRLRPEEYGGRVEVARNGEDEGLDIDDRVPAAVTESEAVRLVEQATESGTALLPQAYPNGSPTHPSYPAGHTTTAGACTTVLKAFFDTSVSFGAPDGFQPGVPSDVLADPDTGGEIPLSGAVRPASGTEEKLEITDDTPMLEAELNKLATNMSIGRNWGGIHYRTDATAGYRLGERVALAYLDDRLAAREGDVTLTVPTFFGSGDLAARLNLDAVDPVDPRV